MMTFFGTRFLGAYSFDLHQIWYTYSLYDFPGHLLIFFRNSSALSVNSVFYRIMDLEKLRVQGAPVRYTFYVGPCFNFAYSLTMVSNYYYQNFFNKNIEV